MVWADLHDCENTAFSFCCFPNTLTNFITDEPDSLIPRFHITLTCKTLKESTIHTMFCHPMKVALKEVKFSV